MGRDLPGGGGEGSDPIEMAMGEWGAKTLEVREGKRRSVCVCVLDERETQGLSVPVEASERADQNACFGSSSQSWWDQLDFEATARFHHKGSYSGLGFDDDTHSSNNWIDWELKQDPLYLFKFRILIQIYKTISYILTFFSDKTNNNIF
jgi:hypothetical protein